MGVGHRVMEKSVLVRRVVCWWCVPPSAQLTKTVASLQRSTRPGLEHLGPDLQLRAADCLGEQGRDAVARHRDPDGDARGHRGSHGPSALHGDAHLPLPS
jgi:hypothetical protein